MVCILIVRVLVPSPGSYPCVSTWRCHAQGRVLARMSTNLDSRARAAGHRLAYYWQKLTFAESVTPSIESKVMCGKKNRGGHTSEIGVRRVRFTVGSDIACQAQAALGCQITRNIHSEIDYRFLYDDYHDTNFLYRVIMHGAQITLGLNF